MFPNMKNTAGDALRQAFMSAEDYNGLREEEKAWRKLQRPLCMAAITVVWTIVVVASMVMVDIVFGVSGQDYPFCQKRRLTSFGMMAAAPASLVKDDDDTPSYAYTEDQVVQFFWFAVFLPSSAVFAFSTLYLLAGWSPSLNQGLATPNSFFSNCNLEIQHFYHPFLISSSDMIIWIPMNSQ